MTVKVSESIDTNGTCLQGYVDEGVTYADLVNVFGDPTCDGDGNKVDAEWLIDADGDVATIYNYKTGPNYDSDGIPVEDHVGSDWHIGGNIADVVSRVNEHIAQAKVKS